MDAGEKQSRHGDTIKKTEPKQNDFPIDSRRDNSGFLLAIGFAVYGFPPASLPAKRAWNSLFPIQA